MPCFHFFLDDPADDETLVKAPSEAMARRQVSAAYPGIAITVCREISEDEADRMLARYAEIFGRPAEHVPACWA